MPPNHDAKLLFLNDIRRAWSAKKFRDKQIDKKPYSFVMSNKVSKILDDLVIRKGLTKSELVEELILKEHTRI